MILPFSTKLNGKPTYFMEKIWAGLEEICEQNDYCIDQFHTGLMHNNFDDTLTRQPKLHTIRADKSDRWKSGVMIDFFINARTKDMFRFAPKIPVISTQKIEIRWFDKIPKDTFVTAMIKGRYLLVKIDGKTMFAPYESFLKKLANNDGFDTPEEMFGYFDKDFTGKIIHWTDLRY